VLLRRRDRLAALIGRLSGLLEATHARSRLVLARHPTKDRWDAFWVVAGTVADWGPLPAPHELAERTDRALAARPVRRRPVSAGDVDEIRIVHTWIAAHDPPRLDLDGPLSARDLSGWVERAVCPGGSSGTGTRSNNGGTDMGIMDKVTGRAKKAAGDLAGDASLKREGAKEERKGDAKDELANAQNKADAKADEVADLERKT
jgi:uncharacterized protein YjbJ (UPF0337 family)